jgi:hypothetical protein
MTSGSREKSSDVWSRLLGDDRFVEAAKDSTKRSAQIRTLLGIRMLLILFTLFVVLAAIAMQAFDDFLAFIIVSQVCVYLYTDTQIKVLKAFEAMEPTPDSEQKAL